VRRLKDEEQQPKHVSTETEPWRKFSRASDYFPAISWQEQVVFDKMISALY
jgi:hypothetical protein